MPCVDGNVIQFFATLINVNGVFFFCADGRASPAYIACKRLDFLNRNHFHLFVRGCGGEFFGAKL